MRILFSQRSEALFRHRNTAISSIYHNEFKNFFIRQHKGSFPLFQLQAISMISSTLDFRQAYTKLKTSCGYGLDRQPQHFEKSLESQWQRRGPRSRCKTQKCLITSISSSHHGLTRKRQKDSLTRYASDKIATEPKKNDLKQNERRREKQNDGITSQIKVRSLHIGQTIDVASILTKVFRKTNLSCRHVLERNSLIIELPPREQENIVDSPYSSSEYDTRYAAIFRYGSVVFFNVSTKDASRWVDKIKKHTIDPISRGFERKEFFEVAISPEMEEMQEEVTADFVLVKKLDMGNVNVIATTMAQTVALDSYNDVVDELLSTFASINSTVKRAGNFTEMEKESLFKVVAQNNSLFIDMIANLGIKDRNYAAWNMSHLEQINEGLRNEFEIDLRFDQIEFKLNLIQQNAKFFVQVLQNQKADNAEWIIIVLIAFECILMLLEMSGIGERLFSELLIENAQDLRPSNGVP